MTTENVAVLFTDIVGSTELSQRLSAEAADDVRRAHFAALRQAVAETGGTEVKNLGDGLMVVFASASAAIGCAVAMQQGVDQGNRHGDHVVGLRVGVSVGEVAREDDDYFGDPVVEAARLCARCASGQVLATEMTRAIAGRRNRHECRPVGELELKGLDDPVDAVEVVWEPLGGSADGAAVPLPARLAVRPDVGVVGRDGETVTMADALKRASSGGGREVVLVSGEAGLGKTTLVAESARAAFASGATVLFGHCEEELATPYQLFAEALGHYVTHAPEDQLLDHVAVHGSELARLVPALASRIPDLPPTRATDSDSERFLLFAAVVGLLATVGEAQPVVLVLDDLQWADKGSLLLLRHLAAADVPMRLLVLGTFRDSELSRSHPFLDTLAALRRLDGVSRIELGGLDDTGVLELMAAAAGHELSDVAVALGHAVYRETDGNPFFVGEVLRHLSETGAIYQDGTGRWMAQEGLERMALPDSVREVIGARVGRLGDRAGRVLSVAAVIGRDFDVDLLARATTTDEDDLLDLLDAAVAAALVRELADTPGRYNFAHALIQHTLYEDLGPTRRARTHRTVAEALEDLCAGRPGTRVGELARHWFHATQPIDLNRAIDYSRQAGDAALAGLAPADALRYYDQALDLYAQTDHTDPVLALDLAIGLGTARRQAGEPGYREVLVDAARRALALEDTDRLVAAILAGDRGFFSVAGVDREVVGVIEAALERLPADHPDRAVVLGILCQELTLGSPLERRLAIADEAMALVRAHGDDATVVRVLNLVSVPLRVPSLLDQSLAWSAEALERADRVGDPVQLFWAADRRVTVTGCSGDTEEMDRCLELSGELADRLGQPILLWVWNFQMACRALIAGDYDRAEQLLGISLEYGRRTDGFNADAYSISTLGGIARQRGLGAQFIPALEEVVATVTAEASELEGVNFTVYRASLAECYAELGQIDDARRVLDELAASGFDFPMDFLWLYHLPATAKAAIVVGDPGYARQLLDLMAPFPDHHGYLDTDSHGPFSRFLGGLETVLGRFDEAEAHLDHAAGYASRVGAPYFAAETDLYRGRLYAARRGPGDVDRARAGFTEALRVAAERGYGAVERQAAEGLQQLA